MFELGLATALCSLTTGMGAEGEIKFWEREGFEPAPSVLAVRNVAD
jgi:hypothetical protein